MTKSARETSGRGAGRIGGSPGSTLFEIAVTIDGQPLLCPRSATLWRGEDARLQLVPRLLGRAAVVVDPFFVRRRPWLV